MELRCVDCGDNHCICSIGITSGTHDRIRPCKAKSLLAMIRRLAVLVTVTETAIAQKISASAPLSGVRTHAKAVVIERKLCAENEVIDGQHAKLLIRLGKPLPRTWALLTGQGRGRLLAPDSSNFAELKPLPTRMRDGQTGTLARTRAVYVLAQDLRIRLSMRTR